MEFAARSVRQQLLLAFAGTVCAFFVLLVGLCAAIIFSLSELVIFESRSALTTQIVQNSQLVLGDVGMTLDAIIAQGAAALVLPLAVAVFDTNDKEVEHSLLAPPLFADNNVADLKEPLVTSTRYLCETTNPDLDPQRGCDGILQQISESASSSYVPGFALDGSNVPELMASHEESNSKTATALDLLVAPAWKDAVHWVDIFWGGTDDTFRQWPGAVGSLEADVDGLRTYRPTARTWFTETVSAYERMENKPSRVSRETFLEKPPLVLSEPYVDAFGRGYLLSLSTPVVAPSQGSLPPSVVGVAGADLLIEDLTELITTIRIRSSGRAHLFAVGTGAVLDRPLVDGAPSTLESVPLLGGGTSGTSSTLGSALDSGTLDCLRKCGCDGSAVAGGHQLVWQGVFTSVNGGLLAGAPPSFCAVTITYEVEILAPIDDQIKEIRRETLSLFWVVLILCACCGAAVLASTLGLSLQMSAPLISMCKSSEQVVKNIGSEDLFEGVSLDEGGGGGCARIRPAATGASNPLVAACCDEVGEVGALRGRFVGMLGELLARRSARRASSSPSQAASVPADQLANPFFRPPTSPPTLDAAAAAAAASSPMLPPGVLPVPTPPATADTGAAAGPVAAEVPADAAAAYPELSRFNSMRAQLVVKLFAPFIFATLVVIIYAAVVAQLEVQEWTKPVEDMMVTEELATLDLRAYEQASYLAATFQGYALVHLRLYKYAQALLVDESLPLATSRYPSYSVPAARCSASQAASDDANQPRCGAPPGLTTHEGAESSPYASVWHQPEKKLPQAGPAPRTVEAEQADASHLDSAFRAAYLGSNASYVYMAFAQSEVYRQFPYQQLTSYAATRECEAIEGVTSVSSYTPLCRPWYVNAVADTKAAVFNPVLEDAANPGFLFISLSRSLWGSTAELVGVVALDISLKELSSALIGTEYAPKRLYKSGYAFVWDASEKGVIHKNYLGEHSASGSAPGGGAVDIARLDSCGGAADCSGSLSFVEQFQEGILAQGRTTGTFHYVWRGQTWHYSFLPVEGTSYMMALTVEQTEVTEVPDAMVARCEGRVDAMAAITVAAFLLALGVLALATRWFDLRFASPVRDLHALVSRATETNYQQDVSPLLRDLAASRELRAIIDNLSSLWAALRFGNAKYHGNNKMKEATNYVAAMKLVERTGNVRGLGICHNNLANLAGQSKEVREQLQLSPEQLFEQAIGNAREHGSPATLAMRLLNCAMWHLREGRVQRASECLAGAASCGADAKTLAAVTATCTHSIGAAKLEAKEEAQLHAAVRDLCGRVVAEVAATTVTTVAASSTVTTVVEAAALADLCVAVADVGGLAPHTVPAAWAAWALQHVPHAKLGTLSRLVLHCKAGAEPSVQEYYDAVVRASFEPKWKGGSVKAGGALAAYLQLSGQRAPMAACFIIDRTWPPILQAAINATAMVFEERLEADDVMALYSLGETFLIKPTRKGGREAALLRTIKTSNKPGGNCKLYSSMSQALEGMAKQDPAYSKWLIVLTDLVDLGASEPAGSKLLARGVLEEMNRLENLNLAIIDSEAISGWEPTNKMWPTFRSNAQMLVEELSGSNKGYHLKADNEDAIREAFAQVASMMGGMNEAL